MWLGYRLINYIKYEQKTKNINNALDISFGKTEIAKSFIYDLKYLNQPLHMSDNTKLLLNNLVKKNGGRLLFFRIDFPYCDDCIFPVINKLINYENILQHNIVFITSFPNEEYAYEFNQIVDRKNLNIVNIPYIELNFNDKEILGSFLFTLDANLKHHNLFFTNKYNLFMIDNFINYIFPMDN